MQEAQKESPSQEEVHGYIESIVFSAEEGGFTVARLKEPRRSELTCIVGIIPSLQPGETIRCKGIWKTHPQYGRQFEVQQFDLQAPSDLVGMQKYLESGMIRGIGPAYAERIVKKFGLATLEVIEKTPERLSEEIPGIGPKRLEQIQRCWQEQRSIRQVMIFLRSYGVSPALAQKIFKAYGDESIEKVRSNPYAMAREIFGIGFKSADAIAQGLGIERDAPIRLDAGIEHMLWELSNEGHVCYPEAELYKRAAEVLEIPLEALQSRLPFLAQEGRVICEEGRVWVKPLYLCEKGIAREIERLLRSPCALRSVDVEKAVEWVEEKLSIALAPEQREGIARALCEKVLILTGGPGTGKSTITKAILSITQKLSDKILLAAPTGRAAKRLSEITGDKASTIHSLLEVNFQEGGFKHGRDNPLSAHLVIIDEASMIDTQLMYHLLKAIPSQARLLLIGDIDQLPSVGPGNVLKDMILSQILPVVQLKQIFRQAAGSQIVQSAHRINQGEFPYLSDSEKGDFRFIEQEDPEQIAQTILNLVKHELPLRHRFHRFEEIQVLSPMKRGIIGTENLNLLLQKALNPRPDPLMRVGRTFHLGDKVMQIRNNYQKLVYNGDVGKIVSIDTLEQELKVAFDERLIAYDFAELDELVLAYAVSIHKYQGSECPCVIIPIHTTHFKLLQRNLLYTGITRGKKLVILIGTKKALAIAIHNEEVHKRHTGLVDALHCCLKG